MELSATENKKPTYTYLKKKKILLWNTKLGKVSKTGNYNVSVKYDNFYYLHWFLSYRQSFSSFFNK